MINYQVTASLLRYIVPFTYEGDFDEACAKIDREGAESYAKTDREGSDQAAAGKPSDRGWIRYTPSMIRGESDLYAYIREEFMFDDPAGAQPGRGGAAQENAQPGKGGAAQVNAQAGAQPTAQPGKGTGAQVNAQAGTQPGAPGNAQPTAPAGTPQLPPLSGGKSGAQWIHRKLGRKTPLAKLVLLPNYKINSGKRGETPRVTPEEWDEYYEQSVHIDLTEMGIYLFRNGLGFVWYELDPGPISSDRLIGMQHYIKELNRVSKIGLLKIEKEPVSEGMVVGKKVIRKNGEKYYGKDIYLTPFFMGKMLVDTMRFLGVTFLTGRKSHYRGMLETADRFIEDFPYEKKRYSAGTLERAAQDYPSFPDSAVLFSYGHMVNPEKPEDLGEEMDRCFLSFYLTKGYLAGYNCSPEAAKNMVHPFKDSIWYAGSEGASYFAWSTKAGHEFYSGGIMEKIKNDYFPLFIKSLYQSYSLFILGRKIQEEIPAQDIEKMSDRDYERIAKRYEEVNLFLTKSMATSVSYIDHQSEFYNYLKERLRIAEDVRSISSGLDALDALQKEERHRKEVLRLEEESRLEKEKEEEEKQRDNAVEGVLKIISYLAIVSALIDSYDFISKLAFGQEESWLWMLKSYPVVFALELLVVLGIAFIAIRGLIMIRKSKKKEEKS